MPNFKNTPQTHLTEDALRAQIMVHLRRFGKRLIEATCDRANKKLTLPQYCAKVAAEAMKAQAQIHDRLGVPMEIGGQIIPIIRAYAHALLSYLRCDLMEITDQRITPDMARHVLEISFADVMAIVIVKARESRPAENRSAVAMADPAVPTMQ